MSLFNTGYKNPLLSNTTPRNSGYVSNTTLLQSQFQAANNFLRGNESPSDLRLLGYTQYCGNSSDCGAGYQCINGICTLVGSGNTSSGSEGCSSGPGGAAGPIPCGVCGYDKDTSCPGPKCCRFTTSGVTCFCGTCPDGGGNGIEYCTEYYATYGEYATGCDPSNTCNECEVVENGQCVAKDPDDAPCHCAPDPDESCVPRPIGPLECCNYKDTCEGRIPLPPGQRYCYPVYRPGIPRCYDPDYKCDKDSPNELDCQDCQDFTKTVYDDDPPFSLPSGCTQTGYIQGGDRKVYLYRCCEFKDTPGCRECDSSNDCGIGKCCVNGSCIDCGTPTGVPCSNLIQQNYYVGNGTIADLCNCNSVTVTSTGFVVIVTYTNTNCNQIAGITTDPLNLTQTLQFDSRVKFEVGRYMNPLSNSGFVAGDYILQKECEVGSIFLPRNGILRAYNKIVSPTTPPFQDFQLWGGNFQLGRGQALKAEVYYSINVTPFPCGTPPPVPYYF